jgi:hypothetical protein
MDIIIQERADTVTDARHSGSPSTSTSTNRKKPEDTRMKITETAPESNVNQGSMYSIVYDSLAFTQGLCNKHTQAINRRALSAAHKITTPTNTKSGST